MHDAALGVFLALLALLAVTSSVVFISHTSLASLVAATPQPMASPTVVPIVVATPIPAVAIERAEDISPSARERVSWQSLIGSSWQWQLDGLVDTSIGARVFDIDYETSTASLVDDLHKKGAIVICYVSVGSWEKWRGDADTFPASVIGKDYIGWPGEKWLDIRKLDMLAPLLEARLDVCRHKGFDAVEPDNIQGFQADTGFPLTDADQRKFNIWIAAQAHARGLLIGLKNDNDQAETLEPYFDFAITEDCFAQGWCRDMSIFIAHGKPVFAAEYTDTGMTTQRFCEDAKKLRMSAILKHRNLDNFVQRCPK